MVSQAGEELLACYHKGKTSAWSVIWGFHPSPLILAICLLRPNPHCT